MVKGAILASWLSLALAWPAAAQQPQQAPPRLDLSGPAEGECKPAAEGEVVVCGERGPSPYRIDPDVLGVMRAKELAENPPRPATAVPGGDPCGVGPNGCPGEGAVPLLAIAITAAKVAVKAIQGEDWREPLRTGPTDYERHLEAKKQREKSKPRVSVGISASGGR